MAQNSLGVLATPIANVPQGELDLIVEGETLTPLFYKGRAEPSAGNITYLTAVPNGINAELLSYRWTINGQVLPGTTARTSITAPASASFQVGVTATLNGKYWSERNEVIALAEPTVLFYEGNSLKGLSKYAIGRDYLLVGEEAEVMAMPYFTGITQNSLRGTWKIEGYGVTQEGDWRQLVLTRPETPLPLYRVELNLKNVNNLNESARNYFNLKMGL